MSNNQLSESVQQGLEEIENEDFLDDSTLPVEDQYREVDYSNELDTATKKAQATINSLYEFYMDQDFIDEHTYLKHKIDARSMTMKQLLFLLKTSQESLIRLMQNINSGEMNARMFEVLATLQRSHLDIVESYSMCLVNAEEEAKGTRNDIEINQRLEGNENKNDDTGYISTDERKLLKRMDEMNEEIGDAGKKDLDQVEKEVEQNRLENKPKSTLTDDSDNDNDIEESSFEEIDEY